MKLSIIIGFVATVVMSLACIPLLPTLGYFGCMAVVFLTAGPIWVFGSAMLMRPRPGDVEDL